MQHASKRRCCCGCCCCWTVSLVVWIEIIVWIRHAHTHTRSTHNTQADFAVETWCLRLLHSLVSWHTKILVLITLTLMGDGYSPPDSDDDRGWCWNEIRCRMFMTYFCCLAPGCHYLFLIELLKRVNTWHLTAATDGCCCCCCWSKEIVVVVVVVARARDNLRATAITMYIYAHAGSASAGNLCAADCGATRHSRQHQPARWSGAAARTCIRQIKVHCIWFFVSYAYLLNLLTSQVGTYEAIRGRFSFLFRILAIVFKIMASRVYSPVIFQKYSVFLSKIRKSTQIQATFIDLLYGAFSDELLKIKFKIFFF